MCCRGSATGTTTSSSAGFSSSPACSAAHAHAGRIELVAEPVDRLRQGLRTLLSGPAGSLMELPVLGTVLHALGMAGLASGDAGAVRMIALAERLWVLRDFQPTMSADRARRVAQDADLVGFNFENESPIEESLSSRPHRPCPRRRSASAAMDTGERRWLFTGRCAGCAVRTSFRRRS
ncbi:hypothetical protein AB0O86_21615 [Streptomyces hirsutus]|uniref:hypothetical protein n=1 Tax=Streptomyces hirsutus TaxID=35620 RepID=UPI00343803B4